MSLKIEDFYKPKNAEPMDYDIHTIHTGGGTTTIYTYNDLEITGGDGFGFTSEENAFRNYVRYLQKLLSCPRVFWLEQERLRERAKKELEAARRCQKERIDALYASLEKEERAHAETKKQLAALQQAKKDTGNTTKKDDFTPNMMQVIAQTYTK